MQTHGLKYGRPRIAIITDAGYASRFLPWTKTNPKAMLSMGNKPIMQRVVEECITAGIQDIIIVTTPEGQPIYNDYFTNAVVPIRKQLKAQDKLSRYEEIENILDFPRIRVIVQDPALPYGNGSPILSARKYIPADEAFVVLYSDDIIFDSSDAKSLIDSYEQHPDADAVIMAQDIDSSEVSKYGIIQLKDGNLLDHIVEKPDADEAPSNLASYGRYLLTPRIFDYLRPNATGKDGELWTVDGITEIAKTGKVYVERTKGKWQTTGDPKNYFMALLSYTLDNEPWADDVRKFVANH